MRLLMLLHSKEIRKDTSVQAMYLTYGSWDGLRSRSSKLSDLMLISQRLKKSIGSSAIQQYGHWSEQNRIIRDENAFSSCCCCVCLDCIAMLLLFIRVNERFLVQLLFSRIQ